LIAAREVYVHYECMVSSPFYILLYLCIGILLMMFAYTLFSPSRKKTAAKDKPPEKGIPGNPGICPACGSILRIGEQVKTVLYPGEHEQLCHVFGCPHCYPYAEKGIVRMCPVCKKEMPPEGYIVARFFKRADNRKHVHILGCTECRLARKGDRYNGK
jgi:hypothetical protein